jgi:hypothetical protein
MNNSEKCIKGLKLTTALLLTALAAACGGGGADPVLGGNGVALLFPPSGAIIPGDVCPAGAGPTIPAVNSSDPTNGQQFVATSTNGVINSGKLVTATFSLPMSSSSINASTFLLKPAGGSVLIPASVGYDVLTNVATFTTSSALQAGTSYTAVVQGAVKSASGTPMSCSYAWTFKTMPAAGIPQVVLGTAAPYAIASAAGVDNTGATTINGNVVLNPTATCNGDPTGVGISGFGTCLPGIAPTLNGTVSTSTFPDPNTGNQVMADLRTAYESIRKASLPGATVLGCGDVGTAGGGGVGIGCALNATLPPGVYISSTNSSIGVTGDLTLDGQGDANARFVFQMPSSTLVTATGSKIILINGAKASNVFWQVGSSATIGISTEFQGNILADASITMLTNATSCGRLLAGAEQASGAFIFDTNTVSLPNHPNAPFGCE